MSFVTDVVAEGRLVFHARCFTESYYTQKEETAPNIKWFETTRLSQFVKYLEASLAFNLKYHPEGYFIGDTLTYVDIAVFHTLMAAESQFPSAWVEIAKETPNLLAFQERISNIPQIKAYLASDRRGNFEGNSMM
jgi:glutathione S-transferase